MYNVWGVCGCVNGFFSNDIQCALVFIKKKRRKTTINVHDCVLQVAAIFHENHHHHQFNGWTEENERERKHVNIAYITLLSVYHSLFKQFSSHTLSHLKFSTSRTHWMYILDVWSVSVNVNVNVHDTLESNTILTCIFWCTSTIVRASMRLQKRKRTGEKEYEKTTTTNKVKNRQTHSQSVAFSVSENTTQKLNSYIKNEPNNV